jgi:alpha-D-xyloside xylohydrolase
LEPGILRELEGLWEPIFARRDWRYEAFSAMEIADGGRAVVLRGDEGSQARLEAHGVLPGVVRWRLWLSHEPPWGSPMLARVPRPAPLVWRSRGEGMEAEGAGLALEVSGRPLALRVRKMRGRAGWGWRPQEGSLLGPTALPLGVAHGPDGERRCFFSWSLAPGERLVGLGEGFGPLNRRGRRVVLWARDPKGALGPLSYIPIPFLMSDRLYGVFLHHSGPSVWELGEPLVQTSSVLVEEPYLDIFILVGGSPAQVLAKYTRLTGRPPLIPLWALGIWFSRCMYRHRAQVQGIVERLRSLGIPGDVVHLDPLWLEGRARRSLDGCHFRWNEEDFGPPQELVEWLRERGFKLCLWENPYVWQDTELFRQGWERGYLVQGPDGRPASSLDNPDAIPVDFTHPQAVRWWQEQHRPFLRMGVAAFKADYGEGLPKEAVLSDGRRGLEVHNLYPLLYNRAVFEAIREERGEAIIFARSGYAGSQRYPLHWTGDAPSTWEGMAATLRAGLSLSLSGFCIWSHDIGGFWNPQELQPPAPELYIRWAQWGLLSPVARFHGIRGREPWYYGQEAVRVVRRFARLRYRLLPYLWALAHEASYRGLPMARPLLLEFPKDGASWEVDWEFMLGPYLLVVPVISEEGPVSIYLPPGVWYDWWTGSRLEGPRRWDERVPLERLPLFVREDSILPLAPAMAYVGKRSWSPLQLEVRVGTWARWRVWDPLRPLVVEARRDGGWLEAKVSPTRRLLYLLLVGAQGKDLQVEGAASAQARMGRRGLLVMVRGEGNPIRVRARA